MDLRLCIKVRFNRRSLLAKALAISKNDYVTLTCLCLLGRNDTNRIISNCSEAKVSKACIFVANKLPQLKRTQCIYYTSMQEKNCLRLPLMSN
jgi:hypothetical protein